MAFTMHTASERPDLWERGIPSESVWPEYNLHGDVLNLSWGHLDEDVFPEGLAPVHIDRATDRGSYWAPNVRMVHPDPTS